MIDHAPPADCARCHGIGRVVRISLGIARSWPCSCPAGRGLALPAAPALTVRAVDVRRRA